MSESTRVVESLTSGTLAGMGSFRCQQCGYVVSLETEDALPPCPGCTSNRFVRASLFSGETNIGSVRSASPVSSEPQDRLDMLDVARADMEGEGQYLVFRDEAEVRVVPLTREWTRIGRSLAADVRFDDPTVSRRHALIVRQPDGVRVLDDRSLNGVFVNGRRIEWRTLVDGDEIAVGRYRLHFVDVSVAQPQTGPVAALDLEP